jgi:hypothetical protein
MDENTERRLRDADPLARRTPDAERDQEWLRETAGSVATQAPPSRRARGRLLVAAAAVAVLAATAGGFLLRDGDDAKTPAVAPPPTVTDLSLPASDPMAMCEMFSVEALAKSPMAFGGEVVENDGDQVLLDVETWYRGGDSDQVRLTAPDVSVALLGGSIEFEVGERYLLTAYDGRVNYCGFSGPWTQEMADAFRAAFGG